MLQKKEKRNGVFLSINWFGENPVGHTKPDVDAEGSGFENRVLEFIL